MRNEIRDREGRLLAYTEQRENGNRIEIRAADGRLLGHYDARRNETRDVAGRLVSSGNTLSTLLVTGGR